MARVIVYHASYNCESGCCGHVVEMVDADDADDHFGDGIFDFAHPDEVEDRIEFAKRLITKHLGADHAADLDWEHCWVSED